VLWLAPQLDNVGVAYFYSLSILLFAIYSIKTARRVRGNRLRY